MNSTLTKKIIIANNKEFLNTLKIFKVNIDKDQTLSKQTYFSIDYINKKLTIKNCDFYNYLINTFSIDTDLVLPIENFLIDTDQLLDAIKSCKKMDILQINVESTFINIGAFNLFFKNCEEFHQSDLEVFNRSTIKDEESQKNLLEFNINKDCFIKNIKNSLNFTSNDAAREHLRGVAIKFKDNALGFYATNGHFLIKINNFHNFNNFDTFSNDFFILPIKLCKNLIASGDILKDNIKIVFDNNDFVKIFSENLKIEGRLISEYFPDVNKIIPSDETFKINLKTDDFLNALKMANNVAGPDVRNSTNFNLNNDKMLLTKKNEGNILFELPLNFNCDNQVIDYNICLNSKFLLKCIQTYKNFTNQDNIFISFQDGDRPIKIKCLDDNKQVITILLMPIRS